MQIGVSLRIIIKLSAGTQPPVSIEIDTDVIEDTPLGFRRRGGQHPVCKRIRGSRADKRILIEMQRLNSTQFAAVDEEDMVGADPPLQVVRCRPAEIDAAPQVGDVAIDVYISVWPTPGMTSKGHERAGDKILIDVDVVGEIDGGAAQIDSVILNGIDPIMVKTDVVSA